MQIHYFFIKNQKEGSGVLFPHSFLKESRDLKVFVSCGANDQILFAKNDIDLLPYVTVFVLLLYNLPLSLREYMRLMG